MQASRVHPGAGLGFLLPVKGNLPVRYSIRRQSDDHILLCFLKRRFTANNRNFIPWSNYYTKAPTETGKHHSIYKIKQKRQINCVLVLIRKRSIDNNIHFSSCIFNIRFLLIHSSTLAGETELGDLYPGILVTCSDLLVIRVFLSVYSQRFSQCTRHRAHVVEQTIIQGYMINISTFVKNVTKNDG